MMRMKAEVEVKRRTERDFHQKLGGWVEIHTPIEHRVSQFACSVFASSGPNILSPYVRKPKATQKLAIR